MKAQKLNEAAHSYAEQQCDPFCMLWSKEELEVNKANSETDIKKWVIIKKSDNTFYSISFQNKELIKALRHTFTEWKYID